jgi:hypothetical protein
MKGTITMIHAPRLWIAAAMAVLVVGGACKDSTAPTIDNPLEITNDLDQLDSVFSVPAVQNFNAASSFLTPAAAANVRASAMVLRAVRMSPSAAVAGRFTPAQAGVMKAALSAMSPAGPGDIFPAGVDGKTYRWNETSDAYEQTADVGAPAQGVRFILYEIDGNTGFPIEPVVEVGYADFDDESTVSSTILRIEIFGVGGDPQYVDYTLAFTSTTGGYTLTTAGYITDAQPSNARTLTFSVTAGISGSGTDSTFTFSASLSLNRPQLGLQMTVTLHQVGNGGTVSMNSTLTHRNRTFTMEADVSIDGNGEPTSVELVFRVNGRLFATVGLDGIPRKPNGDELNEQELELLAAMLFAPIEVLGAFSELFSPGEAIFT